MAFHNETVNFSATPVNFTISGRVTVGCYGVRDVSIALTGSQTKTATTDANGNYSLTAAVGGTYTVTPSRPNTTFSPASTFFRNFVGNQTANFLATTQFINGNNQSAGGAYSRADAILRLPAARCG